MWQIAIYCCYRNLIRFELHSPPSHTHMQTLGSTRILLKFVQFFFFINLYVTIESFHEAIKSTSIQRIAQNRTKDRDRQPKTSRWAFFGMHMLLEYCVLDDGSQTRESFKLCWCACNICRFYCLSSAQKCNGSGYFYFIFIFFPSLCRSGLLFWKRLQFIYCNRF